MGDDERDHRKRWFHSHPKKYYEELLNTTDVYMFVSFIEGVATSCAIVMRHKDRVIYLHGASTREYKEYMSPFALHWYIMKFFMEKGVDKYDMWGIDETRWKGVTRFKRGFGGSEVEYIGSYDFVLKPVLYKMYNIRGRIRK